MKIFKSVKLNLIPRLRLEYVPMGGEMNSNRYEISSQLQISLRCSVLSLCSHELRRNETKTGMDFISVILTEMKFHTCMRFSC